MLHKLFLAHVVARSLGGAGFGGADVLKNLPPPPNTGISSTQSTRLWSQGYGRPPHGGGLVQHSAPTKNASPLGDSFSCFAGEVSDNGSRFRGVSSPSRLREAFDNSL